MSYQHVLLVTDLKDDADLVAQKTKAVLACQQNSKLSVLHIVKDELVGFGYELVPVASLYEADAEKCAEAKVEMSAFLERNQLDAANADITTAISSGEGIISYCDSHAVDLVVIGRHERHGLSAFLNGSTADNIISDIKCDILVVHLDA